MSTITIPGLVDLQVNGFKGVDFSDANLTEADFIRACQEIMNAGATAFLPTMITSPAETYAHNLPLIANVMERHEFRGRLLGIHLEGPFISLLDGARGAHNRTWVTKPDIAYLEKLIEWADDKIRLITVAAEIDGAEQLTRFAVSRGVAVSLGHQMAIETDLKRLVEAGAATLTHLGNGVPAMLPRHNNPIWAGLADDNLAAMIITDGHHLPASVIKTVIRTKGPDKCIVVSDASPLAGLSPGSYHSMGQQTVFEPTGRIFNPATGYQVGSSATMLQCMNHLASLNLLSLDELVKVGYHNPLRLIGLAPEQIADDTHIQYDPAQNAFLQHHI